MLESSLEEGNGMIFKFEEKPLNSRFIKTIWRTQSEYSGSFISTATSHLEMIVTKQKDTINLTVRGPETKATSALVPANAEFIGITISTWNLPAPFTHK